MLTKRDYQEALWIQDACNLSGVVHSFSTIMSKIEGDTVTRNKHPIAVLFSSKIASLTGSECSEQFSESYKRVKEELTKLLEQELNLIQEDFNSKKEGDSD
jgi:hypothetical protein